MSIIWRDSLSYTWGDGADESVCVMKGIATSLLSGEDASEVSFYFDYLIGALG